MFTVGILGFECISSLSGIGVKYEFNDKPFH